MRLRWSYEGKCHCLSLGFEDTPLARTVAEGRARTIEADILSGNFDRTLNKYKAAEQQTAAITVCKLFEKFLAYKRKTSIHRRTLEKYTGLLGHLEIFFRQRSAAAILPEDAEAFREWLLTRLEPVTTSERIGLLKACWKWGMQRQFVTRDPWEGVKVRVPVKRRPAPFTQEEMKRIIEAVRLHPTYHYYADYLEFAFCTGMRSGELIGLRWKSVATDFRSIWIGEALSRGDRKETKTNKARELPLNSRLSSLLIVRRSADAAPDDLVFLTPQGNAIDDHNFRNRAWKPILQQLGLEYRKPYVTRSTNPNNRQLTPQEWQEIAHEQVSETNAQYTVIGGVVLGLFAAAAASPITGELVALFFLHKAWKDTQAVNRNDKAIQGYGCVAHVLPADDLRDFAAQVGPDEVVQQIKWAQQHDYRVSPAALDYLESQGIKPRPQLAASKEPTIDVKASSANDDAVQTPQQDSAAKKMVGSAVGAMTRLRAIGVGSRPTIDTVDVARAIGENLKPTIITAKPRVGKGIIVAHGWRAAKAKHPGLTVWVIQPKPHPSESGYWHGVDRYWGRMIEDYPVDDETISAELSQFIAEWRAQGSRPTLLIIDELGKLGAQQPKWYKREIPPLMIVESSSGETDGRYLWGILQSPLVKDVGISSGNRSAFEFMTIEKADTQDHAIALQQSIASLKSVPAAEDYDAFPVGALCYHSAAGRWMAVPRYDVPAPVETVDSESKPADKTGGDNAAVAPLNLFDELAAEYDRSLGGKLISDFILWLKTKQSEILTKRSIILLWGNKRDRGITSNKALQPFLDEAIALGLLTETQDGYRVIDL